MAEYLLTNEEMRRADGYTVQSLGVAASTLMERAGQALANEAERMLSARGGKVVCVCGGGNNGGDGFVCARLLVEKGYDVTAVCIAERFSSETEAEQKKYLLSGGVTVAEPPAAETGVGLVVDCLYGTGFHGELSEPDKRLTEWIARARRAGAKVLATDIPSGVSGENGSSSIGAVVADVTLCIGEYKAGAFLYDGLDHAGEVKKADIGIVLPETDGKREEYARLSECSDILPFLKKRKRNTHKGDYGKAAIVAGGVRYSGAAVLSVQAALRGGAGYVALFTPQRVLPYLYGRMPEALLCPVCEGEEFSFSEERFEELLRYDCIAFGMGTVPSEEVKKGVEFLLSRYTGKLVLDAGALDSLAPFTEREKSWFVHKKCDVLLTPHPKEFERISGIKVAALAASPLKIARSFAEAYGVNVLLKGASSVITDGRRTFVNTTGTAAQAKGGSGDVLSGAIAALAASGLELFDAARTGAFACGTAAEYAVAETGEISLLPSDVALCLPKAFLAITDQR